MSTSAITPASDRTRARGTVPINSRRVLLVDDQADNLEVLSTLLEDDFEVHVALSADRALEVASHVGDFAVIITDQRMPGMTGVQLLSEFGRRSPATIRMVLTAHSDLHPIVAAVNEGSVYRMFLKPWDPAEMRAAVADAVWLHQAQRSLARLVQQQANRKRELKSALLSLRRSQNQLVASERMSTLGRFSAGITHNIRNSLTVMMHLVDTVAAQQPAETKVVDAAGRAFETLEALLHLANDVSSLARGRQTTITRVAVPMTTFLERTRKTFAADELAVGRSVRITVASDAAVLWLDNERVAKAILALLRAVVRQSPAGSPVEVIVHPLASGGEARLEVRSLVVTPTHPAAPLPAEIVLGLEVARIVAESHGGRLVISPNPERPESAELVLGAALGDES